MKFLCLTLGRVPILVQVVLRVHIYLVVVVRHLVVQMYLVVRHRMYMAEFQYLLLVQELVPHVVRRLQHILQRIHLHDLPDHDAEAVQVDLVVVDLVVDLVAVQVDLEVQVVLVAQEVLVTQVAQVAQVIHHLWHTLDLLLLAGQLRLHAMIKRGWTVFLI